MFLIVCFSTLGSSSPTIQKGISFPKRLS